jgi:F-type H+-transporting ATPase subunit delta
LSALAQRYAAALAASAMEHGKAESVKRSLLEFTGIMAVSADLRNCLASPAVNIEHKQAVIARIVEKLGADDELRNFLYVLVDHGRMGIMDDIRQAYEEELNRRMGIVEASVKSAHELSAEEKSKLESALERVTGKKVEARYASDTSLIGGTTVRIGSTIYDGSVREQLHRLRAQLESQ